jgi:hypothetical protein
MTGIRIKAFDLGLIGVIRRFTPLDPLRQSIGEVGFILIARLISLFGFAVLIVALGMMIRGIGIFWLDHSWIQTGLPIFIGLLAFIVGSFFGKHRRTVRSLANSHPLEVRGTFSEAILLNRDLVSEVEILGQMQFKTFILLSAFEHVAAKGHRDAVSNDWAEVYKKAAGISKETAEALSAAIVLTSGNRNSMFAPREELLRHFRTLSEDTRIFVSHTKDDDYKSVFLIYNHLAEISGQIRTYYPADLARQ